MLVMPIADAPNAVPVRLGARRERRALDADVGAAAVQAHVAKRGIGEGIGDHATQHRAHRIGQRTCATAPSPKKVPRAGA